MTEMRHRLKSPKMRLFKHRRQENSETDDIAEMRELIRGHIDVLEELCGDRDINKNRGVSLNIYGL